MVVQMLLGERHVLECHGTFAAVELDKFIYPNPTHSFAGASFAANCNAQAPPILKVSGRLTLSHPAADTFKALFTIKQR
jgi:hypothetical protein